MNIKSMTGFGRSETAADTCRLSVELKSVNSRFLDLNIKMPKKFNALESNIRNMVKRHIARGKVDLYITYEDLSEGGRSLRLNLALAKEYMEALSTLSGELGMKNDVKLLDIASMPDVFTLSEGSEDDDALWERLSPVLEEALLHFVENRTIEGGNLKTDLLEKLGEMSEVVERIEARGPEIIASYEKKLRDKILEMLGDKTMDDARLIQEVTIFSDRICTDEELVRLRSHIGGMQKKLAKGGPVGRELDFLAQEMNREANTTLSKANDLIVADDAIRLKTLIEKIREQVQNIE